MIDTKNVFGFYHEYVKPLYCEIEAKNNALPVELLFEIHAAFDHLKRIYVEQEGREECCKKAISHLKRGSLDAFKLKLKYFNDSYDALRKSKVDLSLVDNGRYWVSLVADRKDIIQLATEARMKEGITEPELAFDLWSQVSIAINEFEDKYFSQEDKLAWAKMKSFSWNNKDTIKGIVIGFFTGCTSSLLVWFLTK